MGLGFGSKPEKLYCNYGGAGPVGSKKRVKHDFLNKDAGPIGKAEDEIGDWP